MSGLAIFTMVAMLLIYFGGFVYFATRENPKKSK